jgi:hypothetical protein
MKNSTINQGTRIVRFHPQNHTPKIDAKWVKKDNSNSIKIGCTTLDGYY